MRALADVSIRRPVFASMIILALVVVGAASYFRLGVDRLPSVDMPTVSIRASLPGASPEEMESEIVDRIEEAVNTVEGIEEIRSVAGSGTAFVGVTFDLSRDIDVATQDVRDRIATILRDLPDETDPPIVSKFDNDSSPVLTVALSGELSARELSEIADKIVKVRLERAKGVGEVAIIGDVQRTMNVWIDAGKLAAYQIPITAIRDAISRQNADVPGGNVSGPRREQTLRTMGKLTTAAEFGDLVVATIHGAQVRVKDLGRVEDGTAERRSIARLNGKSTVTLDIRRQTKANSVEVIEAAKAAVETVRAELPPGVELQILRDQSRYIYSALHEIKVHLVMGSILASLVVLAFMRNWRSTLIAAVAIPASVIATFGMMWFLGFTLNSVTMLALVLMVGVVIDDAIVVLENIFRFVEEKRMNPFEAARAATAEIALAVMATTFSLVIIFIPVSFMSSISGRFLYQFGITAAVAVMVSLLVSFTLTPMMSARLIKVKQRGDGESTQDSASSRRGFYRFIDIVYTWILKQSLRFRIVTALVAIGVIISSVPLYGVIKQDYLPSDIDEGEFSINITAPEGTSLPAMDDAMRAIEAEVMTTPGVLLIRSTAGGGFIGGVNSGGIHVELTPHEQRTFTWGRLWNGLLKGDPREAFRDNLSQRDIMQELRARLRKFPNVRSSIRNYAAFNIGGGNFDVDFIIRGPDLKELLTYGETLREMTRPQGNQPPKIPGILDADTSLRLDKPELRVIPDRARAADLGVDLRDVGTAMRLMVGGDTETSRFYDRSTNENYDVRLRLVEADRDNPDLIDTLYLPRRGGGLAQLSNVASIRLTDSPSRIDRADRQRVVRLRAGIAPGYAMADRLEAVQKAADEMNMPSAYTTRIAGRGRELERTFVEFIWAFILSIVFMYMILAAQFESLLHPFTILLSLPVAIPFALLSLYLTGGTLNLYSALGILVLFGVVKKNAILQIDHMNTLRAHGLPRYEAIIQANRDRLRPILMTTLSLVAGMLPLALGSGPGSEERRAVAIVVIGGQSLSLLLTLLVTPVAYSYFDDMGGLMLRVFRREKRAVAPEPIPAEMAMGRTDSAGPY